MSEQKNNVLEAVKIWAAAAWADGVIADEEAMTMKAIISVAKLTEDERKTARGWLDEKVSLSQIDISKISADDRLHIFAAACGVVAIDEELASAEKTFLDKLAETLQIDPDKAAETRKSAGLQA